MPIEALQAPGPRVTSKYPGLAGQLAVGLRHESGATFLAAGDETNLGRVEQRIEHFEIALAGDAEGELVAVGAKCGNDELAAAEERLVCCHRCTSGPTCETAI
jgi:hypothetical protein